MKILVISIVFLGIAVLLLGVKVFFVKGGKFPNTHVHGNPALRKRKITCASSENQTIKNKKQILIYTLNF